MLEIIYNPIAIPYALTALFCGILSFWFFLRDDKSAVIWRFAVLESIFAIIAASFAFLMIFSNQEIKNSAKDLMLIAAELLPVVFLSFVYHFIYGDKIKYRRAILILGYAAAFSIILFYFNVFGLKNAVIHFSRPQIGLFIYTGIGAIAIIEAIANILVSDAGIFIEKLKVALLAYLIAVSGTVSYFFLSGGNEIKKSIFFLAAIALFSAFQLYALKRKRISEIGDILKKIAVWIISTAIVFVFLYFILALFRPLIIQNDFRNTAAGFSFLFFLTWLIFALSFKKIDRVLRRKVFEQEEMLKRFRRELITLYNPNELFDRVEQIFFDCLGVESVDFYQIMPEPTPHLSMAARLGAKSIYSIPLPDSGFFNNISKKKAIFVIDDYDILNQRSSGDVKLKEIMIKAKARLLVLLKIRDEVKIVIALGNRKGRNSYTHNSIKIIKELLVSITVAYSNARLYEESKNWSKQLEQLVRERTAELERINKEYSDERDELARLNKVAYDRETRFNDLKKKLEQPKPASLDKV